MGLNYTRLIVSFAMLRIKQIKEVYMPNVKGKKYPYTKEGIAAANKARRGYKQGKRVTKAKGGKVNKNK